MLLSYIFWNNFQHGTYPVTTSGVKYLSSTFKYFYLSSFGGFLYFTIYIFDYFYFPTLLKKIKYFTEYFFPDTQKYCYIFYV